MYIQFVFFLIKTLNNSSDKIWILKSLCLVHFKRVISFVQDNYSIAFISFQDDHRFFFF